MSTIKPVDQTQLFQVAGVPSASKADTTRTPSDPVRTETANKPAGSADAAKRHADEQQATTKKLHQVMLSYYRRDETIVRKPVNLGEHIDIKV